MNITEELFLMRDIGYKQFHQKLMPTVDENTVIGIRVPELRKYAKKLLKYNGDEARAFLNMLPHKYYEENNLHAFMVEQIKDFDEALAQTERFLPYINNWATCDMFMPKAFKKNADMLLPKICEWIKTGETYTVRYAVKLLMNLFLDGHFDRRYMQMAADICSDEYYIKMMVAWYFAAAIAKQYDEAIVFIKENRLDVWTHNKAIQKAVESRRISNETKKYLKTLKREADT